MTDSIKDLFKIPSTETEKDRRKASKLKSEQAFWDTVEDLQLEHKIKKRKRRHNGKGIN